MIFHALPRKANLVVCLKDADVLDLVFLAYALNKIYEKQEMNIQSNKFINTKKIVEYLGADVVSSFPKLMQLQGMTQLHFYILLVKLKCLNGKEKQRLLLNTISASCNFSNTIVEDVEKFTNCLLYWEIRKEFY